MFYYTKHVAVTDTAENEILTVPAGYALYVNYIFIANHGGSTNSVSCWFENSAGVDQLYFLDDKNVSSGDQVTLGGQSEAPIFVLHNGEVVKAQTGSSGDVAFAFTFKLIDKPPIFTNFNGA